MNINSKSLFSAIAFYIPQFVVSERLTDPSLPYVRGQFRHGTLVFADISGFTAMSEKLSELGKEGAEELTSVLNRYFTQMLHIAFSYHGIQLKFGGDAMLLFFLGPRHAARALRCALKMQAAMSGFRQIHTSQGVFRLEMSIGINTGEFFEASVGLPKERLHCVLTGREVNRTAQIEALAHAGQILVGPETLRELQGKVEVSQEQGGCYQVSRLCAHVQSLSVESLHPEESQIEIAVDTLACYLPRPLLERIKSNPEGAGVEGEHRRVSVMFVNVLGMSEVTEEYGKERSQEIVPLLNEYFIMLETTADKYGGVVIGCDLNTEGDKLLVIFGAPVAHEDDEERAVRCALELKQHLAESSLPLRQRIGINTGYVFCGEVGSPLRKEYTVMGDPVNLAARLMSVAPEGQVLIGHSTYSKVADRFVLQAREPVRLKGKSQPVAAYLVEGVREENAPHRALNTGEFVGRENEVALLETILEHAFSGKGQVLAITGPAGIGKSRLVEELKVRWSQHGGAIHSGNCQSYGANTPYLPWIDLLGSFFHLQEDDTTPQRAKKIEATVAYLRPVLKDWAALIGQLLHVLIPESHVLKSLDLKLRHQRLLDVTLGLLQAKAERTPLLLIFEDLHWADTASVELLNYVARNTGECPLLLCTVHRPEKGLELEARKQDNYNHIALGELPPQSSLELVQSMIGAKELPQDFSQLIVARSQGNPLFVEEVVKSLIAAGHLRLDASTGEYALAGEFRQLEVPETIEGVIMARLDQLGEGTRNVLRVAAVIGRNFPYMLLRDVYPRPLSDEELQQRLNDLTRLGLIGVEQARPGLEYCFQHVLTQEVVYGSLLFAQRRELHHKVGEGLEKHYDDQLEEHYELLFYHYDRTRDTGKALEYSVKAGDKAKRIFANREAIRYYQRALELVAELPGSGESLASKVREDLGDVYELTGQYDQALESYQACQRSCASLEARARRRSRAGTPLKSLLSGPLLTDGRDRSIPVLCRKCGLVYERKGQYDAALQWLDKGLEILGQEEGDKAHLWTAKAGVLYRLGEYVQALDWCQRALDLARGKGNLEAAAHGYYLLGTIHTELGNIEEAVRYRCESLSIYEETKDLLGQAKVHNNLGVDYYYQGHWEKAKEHYRRSLELREKIGDVTV